MKLLLRFEFYSVEDLTTLVRQRSQALRWQVEEDVFPQVAIRSRNTPRLCLRLLQSCRRVCRAEGRVAITVSHLERACLLEQIDALGLGVGPTLVPLLNDHRQIGPVREAKFQDAYRDRSANYIETNIWPLWTTFAIELWYRMIILKEDIPAPASARSITAATGLAQAEERV